MSAADIIELIKKLPPEEKAVVAAFVHATKLDEPPARGVSDGDFDRAAKRVFEENRELLRRLAQ